jgi:hypothetical protein
MVCGFKEDFFGTYVFQIFAFLEHICANFLNTINNLSWFKHLLESPMAFARWNLIESG